MLQSSLSFSFPKREFKKKKKKKKPFTSALYFVDERKQNPVTQGKINHDHKKYRLSI